MKHLILAVIMAVITLCSTAQNGGMSNQNNAVRLQYMGLINGNFYVKITNRLAYTSVIRYDYNGNDKTFTLGPNDDTLYKVGTSINGVIKVKNTNSRPHVDNGWVELCLTVTPLNFVKSSATYDKQADEITVEFTVADVSNIDKIVIELSIDGGKTYRQLGLVWPENTPVQKSYKVKISAATIRAIK